MKLEKPILIDASLASKLETLKGKFLATRDCHLVIIGGFTIETKEVTRKTRVLRRTVTEKSYFVTDFELWGWNSKLKFWGTFSDPEMIKHLLYFWDIVSMRERFVKDLRDPIEALGVDMSIKNTGKVKKEKKQEPTKEQAE